MGGVTSAPERPAPALEEERRTDIDGLRIVVCGSVILLHAFLIFADEPRYHLKSELTSQYASIAFRFFHIFSMPTFFVLAGWAAVASLRRREPMQFVRGRVLRLVVPLVGGMLLFSAIIKYIELSNGRDLGLSGFRLVPPLQQGFFDFYLHRSFSLKFVTWSHLWFLLYLFLITILLLPLLRPLARRAPTTTVPMVLLVYIPGLALAAVLVTFGGYWPLLPNLFMDWPNFIYFALCFMIGSGLAIWPGFEARLHAEAPRLVVVMLVAFSGVIVFGESAAGRICVGLAAWGAAGAALGYASRLAPTSTPLFNYLREATMPVFVVHHVPVLLLGLAVLSLPLPIWSKPILIWISATAVSLAAYHWLIRPWPPMRWLMGMGGPPPSTAGATVQEGSSYRGEHTNKARGG
jgi:glucans biosynthesis protein C